MSFAEDILRTTKLKETLSGGQDMEDCSQGLSSSLSLSSSSVCLTDLLDKMSYCD